VTQLRQGERFHGEPQILPGGQAVLFTAYASNNSNEQATIQVQSLTDGVRKTLHRGGYWGHYIGTKDSGFLLFMSQGTTFGVPFDPVRLQTHGTPTPVLVDVPPSGNQFDVSASGTAIYRTGSGAYQRNTKVVELLDALGKRQLVLKKPGTYQRL